jgi:hypothetical protein
MNWIIKMKFNILIHFLQRFQNKETGKKEQYQVIHFKGTNYVSDDKCFCFFPPKII